MKKILCFGDSNTYGFTPGIGLRYRKNVRWTGILQKLLGNEFKIIEAGCNNRTCFAPNPDGKNFIGNKILPELLEQDLNCIIIALGINDIQVSYNTTNQDIENGIQNLINIARHNCPHAKILIISPSKINNFVLKGLFSFQFNKDSIEKSQHIGDIYKHAAQNNNCMFLDLDEIATVSKIDGLHYEPKEHKIIAQAIFEILSEAFKKPSNDSFSNC